MSARKKVLFVAENVTLAQVVRLVSLAKSLDPSRYEVHFASSDFPSLVFGGLGFIQHEIRTLDGDKARAALDKGNRLYEKRTLLRYIEAERELIGQVKPDLVVGDFRLSLSTSAELCGVPCGVLINAYWSPFHERESFPLPDHPIIRLVGERRAAQYFPLALPKVFAHFAAPLNAARSRHGLPPVGGLQQMLTHGDYTLYPDIPELLPLTGAPSSHVFLGLVDWEPASGHGVPSFGDPAEPLVYVTLGSSGRRELLPAVLEALAAMPVRVVAATAGRGTVPPDTDRLRAFSYVAGTAMCAAAALVVTNGGSSTGYQALAQGTPVLGIPTNLDQYLAMEPVVRQGAGAQVPARNATVESVAFEVRRLLSTQSYTEKARALRAAFERRDSSALFQDWVAGATGASSRLE